MQYVPDQDWREKMAKSIGVDSVKCDVQGGQNGTSLVLSFARGDLFYTISWQLPDLSSQAYRFGWIRLAHNAAATGKQLGWV